MGSQLNIPVASSVAATKAEKQPNPLQIARLIDQATAAVAAPLVSISWADMDDSRGTGVLQKP